MHNWSKLKIHFIKIKRRINQVFMRRYTFSFSPFIMHALCEHHFIFYRYLCSVIKNCRA